MKYFRVLTSLFFTVFMLCTSLSHVAFANNYKYFDVIQTNYPEDKIISDNVVYTGNVYYMSKQNGGLFYSHDAKSWHFIDGSDKARIVSDKKQISDSLIVFYEGHLVKSYDGANFELLYTFLPDTVVRYNNGIYIAYEKANAGDTDGYVYCSVDAKKWQKLAEDKITDGLFSVNQYSECFIITGLNTKETTYCAVIDANADINLLSYDYVSYDETKKIYGAIKKIDGVANLYYSDSSNADFKQITLPSTNPTLASYYNGSFYIATVYDDNFFDVYKCTDFTNWETSDKFYMPLYKTIDLDKNLVEVFLWHSCSTNTVGTSLLKTNKNGQIESSSVVLSDGLKLSVYGSVFGITSTKRPLNLLSTDAVCWHQVDDSLAFYTLNEHSLRGDYMFVNQTYDHKIFLPKLDSKQALSKSGIEVRIDGHYIAFDSPPIITNERTMVPLRAICEALGATVEYDTPTKKITITKGLDEIIMTVGSSSAYITYFDGVVYEATLDSPSIIVEDRTLVPVRFISETFNKTVDWEDGERTVWITSK